MVFNRMLLFITFLKDGCKGNSFIWNSENFGVYLTIFEVVGRWKKNGTLIAEGPDIVYFDIKEKVGFRINNSSLCVGCKNKAKIWFCQMLSTKTLTLILVNFSSKILFVFPFVEWRIFCTFVPVFPVSLAVDKLDIVSFKIGGERNRKEKSYGIIWVEKIIFLSLQQE